MSLTLDATREGPPWPLPTTIELACDGDHGLLEPTTARYPCEPWVATALSRACADGWKETYQDGVKKWARAVL